MIKFLAARCPFFSQKTVSATFHFLWYFITSYMQNIFICFTSVMSPRKFTVVNACCLHWFVMSKLNWSPFCGSRHKGQQRILPWHITVPVFVLSHPQNVWIIFVFFWLRQICPIAQSTSITKQSMNSAVPQWLRCREVQMGFWKVMLFRRLYYDKKAVLPQGNRAMPQVFFSVEVRQPVSYTHLTLPTNREV